MHKAALTVGYLSIVLAIVLAAIGYYIPPGYWQDLIVGVTGTFLGLGVAVLAVNFFLGASDRKAAAGPLLKLIHPNVMRVHNDLFVRLWNESFGIDEGQRLIDIYQKNKRNPKAFSPEQIERIYNCVTSKKDELVQVYETLGDQLRELSTLAGWSFDPHIVAGALEARLNFVTVKSLIAATDTDSKYKLVEAYLDGEAAASNVLARLTKHLGLADTDWKSDV